MQVKQTIVDDHRNMLMLTKNISDFQENNLKTWAFIFFTGVDKVQVSWDFIRRNKNNDFYPGKVTFDIKFKKEAEANLTPEATQTGVDQLVASTKFLFWSETKVNVKINGKKWKNNLSKESATSQTKNEQD